jgi:hypothetical protein
MEVKKDLEWIKIGETSAAGVTMEEFIDVSHKYCKQVWSDGYEEIFELSGRFI